MVAAWGPDTDAALGKMGTRPTGAQQPRAVSPAAIRKVNEEVATRLSSIIDEATGIAEVLGLVTVSPEDGPSNPEAEEGILTWLLRDAEDRLERALYAERILRAINAVLHS